MTEPKFPHPVLVSPVHSSPLLRILSYLPPSPLLSAAAVSKHWHAIATSNVLWRSLAAQRWNMKLPGNSGGDRGRRGSGCRRVESDATSAERDEKPHKWLSNYATWHCAMRLPHGQFSNSNCMVFVRSAWHKRHAPSAVNGWFAVMHSDDAQLHPHRIRVVTQSGCSAHDTVASACSGAVTGLPENVDGADVDPPTAPAGHFELHATAAAESASICSLINSSTATAHQSQCAHVTRNGLVWTGPPESVYGSELGVDKDHRDLSTEQRVLMIKLIIQHVQLDMDAAAVMIDIANVRVTRKDGARIAVAALEHKGILAVVNGSGIDSGPTCLDGATISHKHVQHVCLEPGTFVVLRLAIPVSPDSIFEPEALESLQRVVVPLMYESAPAQHLVFPFDVAEVETGVWRAYRQQAGSGFIRLEREYDGAPAACILLSHYIHHDADEPT